MGDKAGFGTESHRLAVQAFNGHAGAVETWWLPQEEAGGAVAAVGEAVFSITTLKTGTLHMYLGGIYTPVSVTDGMILEYLVDACIDAIADNKNLAVDGEKNIITPYVLANCDGGNSFCGNIESCCGYFETYSDSVVNDLTIYSTGIESKSKGLFGNEITIAFNLVQGQFLPEGIESITVTPMSSGATPPDITDALDALGTGDDANEKRFTAGIHPYGQDSATLAAISTYIGATDSATGTYLETCKRPFYFGGGHTVAGSAGLTALIAITDARLTQRGNAIMGFPGEYQPGSELAANVVATCERLAASNSAANFVDEILNGVTVYSISSDRWTNDHTQRESAVNQGIGTSQVKGGALTIQNHISMSRPASVPVGSNVYRDISNQVKTQNIIFNLDTNFQQAKWAGIFIVEDVSKVAGNNKTKARDVNSVLADLVNLANSFAGKGWLYSASFTIDQLRESGSIIPRVNGTGFDYQFKAIYSGTGGVIDGLVEADISLAVFLT